MWEFYLAGSETSFRVDGHMVMQLQLAKRQEPVPLTRDYILEREAELRRREAGALGDTSRSGVGTRVWIRKQRAAGVCRLAKRKPVEAQ